MDKIGIGYRFWWESGKYTRRVEVYQKIRNIDEEKNCQLKL